MARGSSGSNEQLGKDKRGGKELWDNWRVKEHGGAVILSVLGGPGAPLSMWGFRDTGPVCPLCSLRMGTGSLPCPSSTLGFFGIALFASPASELSGRASLTATQFSLQGLKTFWYLISSSVFIPASHLYFWSLLFLLFFFFLRNAL